MGIVVSPELFTLAILAGYYITTLIIAGVFVNFLYSRFSIRDPYYRSFYLYISNSFLFAYTSANTYFTYLFEVNQYYGYLLIYNDKSITNIDYSSLILLLIIIFSLGIYVYSNPGPKFTDDGISSGKGNVVNVAGAFIFGLVCKFLFIYSVLLTFSIITLDLSLGVHLDDDSPNLQQLKSIYTQHEFETRYFICATILPVLISIMIGKTIYIYRMMDYGYLRKYRSAAMKRYILLHRRAMLNRKPKI